MKKKAAFYARISKASRQSNTVSNSINSQISILYDTIETINSKYIDNNDSIDIDDIQIYIEMKIANLIQVV